MVNKPSDGKQRKNSTAIFLTTGLQPPQRLAHPCVGLHHLGCLAALMLGQNWTKHLYAGNMAPHLEAGPSGRQDCRGLALV